MRWVVNSTADAVQYKKAALRQRGAIMQYFDREQVETLLPMQDCIALMRQTLLDYTQKNAVQVLRTAMQVEESKILGVMPAAYLPLGVAGTKVITVFPGNFKRGLPSHQGVVVLFDTETGALRAVVDGEAVTGVRTAAVSAVATDRLARKGAEVLAILGAGQQARRHLQAISMVRPIREVRVWDIDPAAAARYAAEMQQRYGILVRDCSANVHSAVKGSDIICTVTAAKQPVLFGADVAPGTHINAVGACAAADRELDTALVQKARLFCDSVQSAKAEAGDYLIPLQQGAIAPGHLLGELGAVLSGTLAGRVADNDITIFEALGLAVEDLAAANAVAQRAAGQA